MNDNLPAEEIIGNAAAEQIQGLARRLAAAKQVASALLMHVSTTGTCKGCGEPIRWVHHVDTGKHTPYNLDGINHFVTCPDRVKFKKKEPQHGG
jgi:hypothetical protein